MNKILIKTCLILLPFLTIANNINLDVLAKQQNAIANVQYDTNVSHSKAGSTPRGDIQQAIASLKVARSESIDNDYLYLQFSLSLAALDISSNNLTEAKNIYFSLVKKYPENPIVQIYAVAYLSIWERNEFNSHIAELEKSQWKQMPHYVHAIKTAKNNFSLEINENTNKLPDLDSNSVAIIVLGYALNSDGSINDILSKRLEMTLTTYQKYPNAKIIVSGGASRNGLTEAYQMKQWLISHQVPADQIIIEDQSISTVWNALNSINIITSLNAPIKNILLVTSSAHIKRANATFKQAINNKALPIKLYNLASKTPNYNTTNASDSEKAAIVRDTLRVAGLWQMPGMVI